MHDNETVRTKVSLAGDVAMEAWYWIIALVVAGLGAFFAARIAGGKGYSQVVFGILGFFLPLIGIIIAAVLPRKASA
jgi:hypothetical protein